MTTPTPSLADLISQAHQTGSPLPVMADPRNLGLNVTGAILAKPYRDPETKRWTMAILPSSSVTPGSPLPSLRVAIMTSTGQVTPGTIDTDQPMAWSNSGNLLVHVKRDTIPADLKAARDAFNAQAKAQYQAAGGPPPKAAKAPKPLPTIPGQPQAPTAPQAQAQAPAAPQVDPTALAALLAAGIPADQALSMLQAAPQVVPQAPKPTKAPKGTVPPK